MKNPKRILIFSDSQALPRGTGWGSLAYEQTYPYRLHEIFRTAMGIEAPLVLERGKRYRTIEDVGREWEEEVVLKRPDVVVLNVGGSDCAPRLLPRKLREFCEDFPLASAGRQILKLEARWRRPALARFGGRPYVSLDRFSTTIEAIVRRAAKDGVRRLILANIMPVSDKLEFMCPGVRANVRLYNDILVRYRKDPRVTFFDLHARVEEWGGADRNTVDSMHFKPEAHAKMAEALFHLIMEEPHGDREPRNNPSRRGNRPSPRRGLESGRSL